ncbi:MAG TPA: RNA-binding protein [Alphaproteobacteria bacterium]|nr:RNA-binding protein [Alphaproteobacteria bacterium]
MRLYVGNLQREFNEVDVRELFSPYGQVDSVTIIRDSDTRRPKGFAFVEMPIVIQAKAAINALNGKIFHQPTRTLIVNEADSQLDRIVRKAVRRARPLSRLIPIRYPRAHHR